MIIDVHCHYTLTAAPATVAERFSFEPARHRPTAVGIQSDRGHSPDATAYDSCAAPRATRRLAWRGLRALFGIDAKLPAGAAVDVALAAAYARHLSAPGPIDRYVLLAFDWYHTTAGRRPALPTRRGDFGGDIYTSNSLIRDLCRRHRDRFLFGASIHPYRENAPACIEEVFSAGACLVKWLPLHQNIDIADPRSLAVLRKCYELNLPVLAHYGEEFTLRSQHRAYERVIEALRVLRRLRRDGCMPPFIVAHVATPITPFGDTASWRLLCDALTGEFADAPLYADISALGVYGKFPFLRKIADRQGVHGKLLFGTDFPVPLADPIFRMTIGKPYREMLTQSSWPQRYAMLCRHVGFNDIVFYRAATLLPNVEFFSRMTETNALAAAAK